MEENAIVIYKPAAETIKTAILQGQYEAAKGVNRIQLAVYFGIGKYVSLNTRKGVWGTGALEAISQILRKELPGLKGYSATQLREMRLFYEAWQILDPNSSVMTDESSNQTLIDSVPANSSVMTDELHACDNQIDIYHSIQIPNLADFPVEDFFKVPFTHHTQIRAIKTSLEARYYYIHRTAEEHLTTRSLEKLIKDDAFGNRDDNVALKIINGRKVLQEGSHLKSIFGEIDEVRTGGIGEQVDSGSKPTGVTAHDFNDEDFALLIALRVDADVFGDIDDVFRGGAITVAVVGDGQVVIDGFGDANDFAIDLLLGEEFGQLRASIHGVIATIDEDIADVMVQDRLANGFITEIGQIGGHFVTGGSEDRARGLLQ